MAFNIPASVIGPVTDAIHETLFGLPKPKKTPIEIPKEDPPPYDSQTPNKKLAEGPVFLMGGIGEFYSKIRTQGTVSKSQFIVLMDFLPAGLADIGSTIPGLDEDYKNPYQDTSFFGSSIEDVVFPGTRYLTTEYRKPGMVTKVPYLREYPEVDITFRCDGIMWERRFFDAWVGLIENNSSLDFKFKDDYVSPITIIQLDHEFQKVYAQTLFNAYPISVGDIQSSYSAQNQYQTFTVTFAYDFVKQRTNPMYLDEKFADLTDSLETSEATASPNFPGSKNTIHGAKGTSPIDRVMNEILKAGKGILGNKIIKHLPVGNIPGIGPIDRLF